MGALFLLLFGAARLRASGDDVRRLLDVAAAGLLGFLLMDGLARLDLVLPALGEPGSILARVSHNTGLHVVPALTLGVGVVAAFALLRGVGVRLPVPGRGDAGAPAVSLSTPARTTWRAASVRFVVVVLLAVVALMALRGATWDPGGPWILIPIAVGMTITALAEETLFRGLLRPAAEDALGAGAGNLLQAFLFAACHLSVDLLVSGEPRLAAREAARLALWFALGWFFGLAARDTRGIGVPVVLHVVIGLGIYVTLVFKPATGFLG